MKDLIPIEEVNGIELFTSDDALTKLLDSIKEQTVHEVFDCTTSQGRKDCAALAYKVARSKTAIDNAGKDLVKGWKDQAKVVDNKRKESREFLTDLQSTIRQPVTEWEEEEAKVAKALADAAKLAADESEAYAEHEVFLREEKLRIREAELEAAEAERTEQVRIDAMAEAARVAAKDAAANAIKQAERRADEAAAEERRKIAAERAEEARILEQEAEQARIKSEDVKHRQRVNRAALEAFIACGIDEETAKSVIRLVATHKIPKLEISY